MKNTIYELINKNLEAQVIEITDISHQHAGHYKPAEQGETHFHIKIVSKKFQGLSHLERHRLVLGILGEITTKIHAISLDLSA